LHILKDFVAKTVHNWFTK